MSHSIEKVAGDWHGGFHRINQDGKRRIMVWSGDLHKMLGIEYPKHRDWISSILIRTGLRDGIDYQHGRNHGTGGSDTHLSISAVQAVLVSINTDLSWKYHNELSDLINRGFSNDPKNHTSRSPVSVAPTHPPRELQSPVGRSSNSNKPHRSKRR